MTHAAPPKAAPPPTAEAIAAAILALTSDRGPAKSICPSEVARALQPNWQSLLTEVRRVACRLATEGRIDILRKGHAVPPTGVKGVIRLRQAQPAEPEIRPEPEA